MTHRFVSYARKSSKGDTKQIESIQDQEKILRELVARERLTVVERFSEARSAKEPNTRPAFRSMLDMVKAGKADAILCWHLNRLTRNPLEAGELQWLLQSGTLKCIKTPEREYHPEDHALLMAVESSMAAQYVRDLRRDVSRGVREKVERGWYPYRAKAGYLVDPVNKELIPDPIRFPLLRHAWELMLTRIYSVPQILEELNRSGYRSPRTKTGGEKPMPRSALYRMFNDPFYSGVFHFDGEDRISRHEPMVSREEFKRVQQIIGKPHRAKPQAFFHPYAGLVRCGTCGCLITAETHVKRYKTTGRSASYTYYHCTGRKGCRKISNTELDLEGQLLRELTDCKLDPNFIEWALQTLEEEQGASKNRLSVLDGSGASARAILKRKLDRLFTMRENEEITAEEFAERKSKHLKELGRLDEEATHEADKQRRDRETLENILVFTRDWYDRFTGKRVGKRQVAATFAKSYVLTLGKLSPTCHPAIDRIRTFERTKSPDQQIGPGGSGFDNPNWRRMWDELRTLVKEADEGFEAMPAEDHQLYLN